MKLIFMRHGQAAPYCADDAGRDLTEFGRAQVAQSAEQIATEYHPDVIVTSPYNRAVQTASIVQAHIQTQGRNLPLIHLAGITPDDDPGVGLERLDMLLSDLNNNDEIRCVLVVCHMPIIARMTAILTGDDPVSFELAEYRSYEAMVIAGGLGVHMGGFCPIQP